MRGAIYLAAGVFALLAAFLGPARATQATLVTPGAPLPMTSLATFLNNAFLSIGNCNSGTSAPTNGPSSAAFAGQCWVNTTGTTWKYQWTDDASHWAAWGYLNTNTHIFTPAGMPESGFMHAVGGGI